MMPSSKLITLRLPTDIIESIELKPNQTVGLWIRDLVIDYVEHPPPPERPFEMPIQTMTMMDDFGNPVYDEFDLRREL